MNQPVDTTAGVFALLSQRAPHAAFAEIGRTLVCVSNTPPSPEDIADLKRHVQTLQERHETVGVIVCVGEQSTPGKETRQQLVSLYRGVLKSVPAAAFVLSGEGIVSSVQENLATAIIRAVGMGDSLRVFRDLDAAINWVADETRQGPQAADLRRTAHAFRDEHAATP